MLTIYKRLPAGSLGFFAAFLLISASAAQGAIFGWELGAARSPVHGLIFASASCGGAILAPLSWLACVEYLKARHWVRSALSVVLAVACLVYAFMVTLGFVATSRVALVSERSKDYDAQSRAKIRYHAALLEHRALPPARSPAELEPIIAKLRATPGVNACQGEPDGPISRRVCGLLADMQSEAARAKRRAELDAAMREAESAIGAVQTVGTADPQAETLASYLSALGWQVTGPGISQGLMLAACLFFELAAGLSLVVARALQPAPEPPRAPAERGDDDHDTPAGPPPKRGRKRAAALGTVLETVRANGGKINAPLAGIAKLVGSGSKSSVHRALYELERLGQIAISANSRGMAVWAL